MKILCLSNGHGEDAIAVRIIAELQKCPNPPEIAALPLVGEGQAYAQLENVSIIGPVKQMPSGGFIYMEGQQLWRDLKGGLLQLTTAQSKAIETWVASERDMGERIVILAVGDIVPLSFAWKSGADYLFVGTAKSEYYLRDEKGLLPRSSWSKRLESWSGSVYQPWERWLMSRERCKAVFPRDRLTAKILQEKSIRAYDLGNPMMDGLEASKETPLIYGVDIEKEELKRSLAMVLLPGSRSPEAYANWELIMEAVEGLIEGFPNRKLIFLGAIAGSLSMDTFAQRLENLGWNCDRVARSQSQANSSQLPVINPANARVQKFMAQLPLTFTRRNATLTLNCQAFNEFIHRGDLAIAMAGTATEQFVGLGKPAIAILGIGPQFTPAFAEAQSRLLGPSLIVVKEPRNVVGAIKSLLRNPQKLQSIANNGRRRMGEAGASRRIAEFIMGMGNANVVSG
ncbi:MAG: lipid-A-disaccharide synthase-related protein [Cyanobacteriota bacterium]|nr:lipid-A-disaccharide synthase-related protein [Cyanobacteriota bacterium]